MQHTCHYGTLRHHSEAIKFEYTLKSQVFTAYKSQRFQPVGQRT